MAEQEHSPLGASGADRWMNCPGSIALLKRFELPESDEEDYQAEGTALHEATAACLRDGMDAWEVCGQVFHGIAIDVEMAEAVQVSLDVCRPMMVAHGTSYIEHRFSSPIHAQFYGTLDFGVVADSLLNVVDHKFGKGLAVEVDHNPQLMYYAYGLLQHYPDIRRVVCRIVQPRAFHVDGPVRRWETTAEDIHLWVENELLPAMNSVSTELDAGKWCRFCPAKLICPLLTGLFETACNHDPKAVPKLTSASLGRSYSLTKAVEAYISALEKEVLRRNLLGETVDGTKLVHKRARRVWKDGAEVALRQRFGDAVMHPSELKSPAQVEEIHPDAAKFLNAYAYTPESGLTVALDKDNRVAVKPPKASEVFKGVVDAVE